MTHEMTHGDPRPTTPQTTMKKQFGTIEQLKSGSFRAIYRHNKQRFRKTFPTKAAAEQWLQAELKLIAYDIWEPPATREALQQEHKEKGLTVGDWVRQWLDMKKADWKPSTHASHERTCNLRILDTTGEVGKLKDIPLKDLTRADIITWVNAMKKRWPGQPYSKHAYKRLHSALEAAVTMEKIPTNPCQGIKNVWPAPERKDIPDTEVMHGILEHMLDRYRIVTVLTFFHGMRIGEVLALRRKDVERRKDGSWVVHVRGTCFREPGVGMVRMDSPKTAAGYRSVPVFAAFAEVIEHHLETYVGKEPGSMVCVTASGEVVMDTSYRSRLATAKKAAGYEDVKITPHYGRVWLITTLVEAGMTIPAIGEILGQRDLKTITEVYMRTSEARKREVLESVNKALGG